MAPPCLCYWQYIHEPATAIITGMYPLSVGCIPSSDATRRQVAALICHDIACQACSQRKADKNVTPLQRARSLLPRQLLLQDQQCLHWPASLQLKQHARALHTMHACMSTSSQLPTARPACYCACTHAVTGALYLCRPGCMPARQPCTRPTCARNAQLATTRSSSKTPVMQSFLISHTSPHPLDHSCAQQVPP